MFNGRVSLTLLAQRETFLFLLLAFVCGIYSSSTPDEVTFAEVVIGALLLYFVGFKRVLQLLSAIGQTSSSSSALVPNYVLLSMMYLLLVPTITGLGFRENDLVDFARDIIPTFYLFIPVLLMHRFNIDASKWLTVVLLALGIVGISYSIRHFTTTGDADISQIGREFIWGGNLDNISQDPAVLYMMAFLAAFGISEMVYGNPLYAACAIGLSTFPWAANIASVTRSSIGLSFITLILAAIYLVPHYKVRNHKLLISSIVLSPFLFILYGGVLGDFMDSSIGLLFDKNGAHGLSSRDTEISVIWDNADTLGLMLFGTGWGGVFLTPIGDGGMSRYSHNSFVYFFLKGGIFGFVCYGMYIFWYASMLKKIMSKFRSYIDVIITYSLLSPLFVSLMLEPMYKSLSCGLVLSLIPLLWLAQARDAC